MSGSSVLPGELDRFLALPRPVGLLVRGGPGTGRTLLARAIASQVEGSGVLLTDEASPSLATEGLATRSGPVSVRRIYEMTAGRDRVHPLDAPPTPGGPPPVGRASCAVLVVDSWDAFADHMLSHARRGGEAAETERGLFEWISRGAERVIAIAGQGRTTAIEYRVDGIVEMLQTHADERAERWLRIIKLRDVEIARTNYPFTLSEGRFRAFSPLTADALTGFAFTAAERDPEPRASTLWPGAADFAAAFGRLPGGGVTFIETDASIPPPIQLALAAPVFTQVFLHEERAVLIPPPTVFPSMIWAYLRATIPPDRLPALIARFHDKVRLLAATADGSNDPDFGQSVLPLREYEADSPFLSTSPDQAESNGSPLDSPVPRFPTLVQFLNEAPGERFSSEVVFVDGLVAAAREIGSGYTAQALASVIQRDLLAPKVHVVIIGRDDDPLTRPFPGTAAIHIRLVQRQGRYFVRGIRPWTGNFVLLPPASGDSPATPYRLAPVS